MKARIVPAVRCKMKARPWLQNSAIVRNGPGPILKKVFPIAQKIRNLDDIRSFWTAFHPPQHLFNSHFHVSWMRALPIDPLTGGTSTKHTMAMKHKLRDPAFGLTLRRGLQLFITEEAPRKESSRIRPEPQSLQDRHNLKVRLVFFHNDDVSEKEFGFKLSIPSQDDPFFLLGSLDKTMQIISWKDTRVKAKASQPPGEFSQGRVNDESLFQMTSPDYS